MLSRTCPFVCILFKASVLGAFLMVQWLGIYLAVQGMLVQSLAQEDFICCAATKPVAVTIEPVL